MPGVFWLDPVSLLLGLLVFISIWKISQSSGRAGIINKLPGPMAFPLLGNVNELLEPREKVLENNRKRQKRFGPLFRIWIGLRPGVSVTDPEHVEIILKSSKHSEKGFLYKFLHPWLGTGLLTSHGKKWAMHRKLITPTFHFKILQGFIDVFHENAILMANNLKDKAKTKEEFDIYSFVTLCTLDIICGAAPLHTCLLPLQRRHSFVLHDFEEILTAGYPFHFDKLLSLNSAPITETAMGTKVNAQSERQNPYVLSVYRLSALVVYRTARVWLHPDFIFKLTGTGKEFEKHLNIVQGFTNKVIKSRKEAFKKKSESQPAVEKGKKMSFLDLLLESSMEERSSLLTDEEIREEVETFMFEGHDTTASGISWAISILGSHPKIQEECHQELKTIFQYDPERTPTLTDLTEMKLLERVIKETLRMYPSVTSITRTLEEDVQFGKYLVPKGTEAIIGIHTMHRNPKYYPNPDQFDPDRFLPENSINRHPYSYLPFSAGPRNCIGQKFALFEEKVVLSTLIRNYKFESVEVTEKTIQIPDLVLRPGSGIKVKISKR